MTDNKIDIDFHIDVMNHGEQNLTLTFKVKGQGHCVNALKLAYFLTWIIIYTSITNMGNKR